MIFKIKIEIEPKDEESQWRCVDDMNHALNKVNVMKRELESVAPDLKVEITADVV